MINVFLDDRRPAPKGYKLVRTVKHCIKMLETRKINAISLDYNLGYGKPTGYRVVKYMVNHRLFPNKIIIHSNSPRGRLKMMNVLNQNKPKRVPVTIRRP